uniref:Hypothetical secreted protein n=1 Tax=Simulium vittatum TaxID=7192 RepID=B5M0M3_SIMVI|nr:hypothetical secreted protein [Simulium vittatum]
MSSANALNQFLFILLLFVVTGACLPTQQRLQTNVEKRSAKRVEPNTKHIANYGPPSNGAADEIYQKPVLPGLPEELMKKIKQN